MADINARHSIEYIDLQNTQHVQLMANGNYANLCTSLANTFKRRSKMRPWRKT